MPTYDDYEAQEPSPRMRNVKALHVPSESPIEKHLVTPLEDIPESDRIDLYEALKAALPPHKLEDIDLTQELVLQFMRVKQLQVDTLADQSVAANQKAQVANSVATILSQLTRLQTELHNSERFKLVEGLMIRYFKKLPADVVAAFIDEYEQLEDGN